jgi:hypothetical protein
MHLILERKTLFFEKNLYQNRENKKFLFSWNLPGKQARNGGCDPARPGPFVRGCFARSRRGILISSRALFAGMTAEGWSMECCSIQSETALIFMSMGFQMRCVNDRRHG